METPKTWQVAPDRALRLDEPRLMGVLNVTPDSFSDGGAYRDAPAAVEHALSMIEQGACIIDVGGESTRPGAQRVTPADQVARTTPVIEQLRRHTEVLISIDTTSSLVAASALDAGADIINDVAAGTEDDGLGPLAAKRGCGLVLMHRLVPPEADTYSDQYDCPPQYGDVVAEVRAYLDQRCAAAIACGVSASAIVIDPGLGFGKTVEQNYELIRRTRELSDGVYPLLSAASRKSLVGAVTGESDPRRRIIGSTAVSVIHWLAGVRLFRVHDVAAHREALAVAAGITAASVTV
ncbi:MAG: dihydropteroate synthase [Planctomycetota bacterium]|jgi:dihydropteroate synthase